MDAIADFIAAIERAGLPAPETVLADGALHRFGTNGRSHDDSGWYVLHDGAVPAGAFGDWRTGFKQKWRANIGRKLTDGERGTLRKQRMIERLKRKQETARLHAEAAEFAAGYVTLPPAPPDHPYFARKGIAAPIRIDDGGLLVVPMYADGKIANLQTIDDEGAKRYLPGGRVKGCYFPIGAITETLVIVEGVATGASVYSATGYAVAVAFNAGNLLPVAEVMRQKYPAANIVLAADNDVRDDGTENTGIVKATAAAAAVGGRVAVPELDGRKCDFNDLHAERGVDAVRDCIMPPALELVGTELAANLLDDVRGFIARFVAFPDEHALIAATLWAVHTHMAVAFHVTPRLALLSPEPASGKTRVLEVLELLTPDSMLTLNASPAAIFRTLEGRQITLLFDEVDAIWNKRGKDDGHEDLRALLNAGYKRGATIPRCVGPQHEVTNFGVFCAVALAGLGDLPDTIMSRSVIVRMRRRAPGEKVSEFRTRKHAAEGHALRDRLAIWAAKVGTAVGDAWPALPAGIVDRPAEIWEPLIAIADAAGGHWPETARKACVALCRVAEDRTVSLGIRLLSDLRIIFGSQDALHTETILQRLHDGDGLDDDAPWSDLKGKPLGDRGLAQMLKKYSIKSRDVKIGGSVKKGYRREHLHDAWQRYLPDPALSATSATSATARATQAFDGSGSGSGLPLQALPTSEALPLNSSNGAGCSPGSAGSACAGTGATVPDIRTETEDGVPRYRI